MHHTIRTFVLIALGIFSISSFARAQSDINLTGYTQTFDDEFNSLSITTANPKGSSTWFAGPANGSPGDFSESNWNISAFSVSSGILSDQAYYANPAVNGQNWQSGLLSSVDPSVKGFSQLYGYFEIRCEMPNAGEGAWPSFWLDSTSGISAGQNEEIDIFEWYGVTNTPGSDVDYVQEASHNWNSDNTQNQSLPYLYSPETNMPSGAYPWQGYHIYGCQVDPVHVTWYIDGVQTNQIATPTTYLTSPFYLILDYALGGGWSLSGTPFTTDGSSSLLVDWVRVYSLPPSGSAPAAPTGLTATAGNAQVVLSWAASSGATSYNVYRGTSSGGETSLVTNITTTSYSDGSAANGTTYYYKVAAVNSYGTSGYSNEASATPVAGSATTYYQDGFSRSGELQGSSPDVHNTGSSTWTVSTGTGAYTTTGSVLYDKNANYDAAWLPVNGSTGVTLDGTKNFTLSALITPDASGYWLGISLNTAVPGSGGNIFSSGLFACVLGNGYAGAFSNGNNLTYYYSLSQGTAYVVSMTYNATAGTIAYTVGSSTIYTLGGVTVSQIASARAIALGNSGCGTTATFDNYTLTVGGSSGGSAPSAPTGLGATAGNAKVTLSWTASSGATSYNVYRGTTSGGETSLASNVTTTSYTDGTAANGTKYYYKVAAVNSYGTSGYSNEVSATPVASSTVYYQDGFSRSGELQGSAPDVHNTSSNTYTVSTGTGSYTTTGSVLYDKNPNYDAAWLPVNGSSGVTLDGTKNFTLSALITPDTSGYWLGISLNSAVPGSGGNIFSSGLYAVVLGNGYAGAFNGSTNLTYNYSLSQGTPYTVSLVYSVTAGTIAYNVGSTTIYTLNGVTASQIASTRAIALGNSASGTSATFDNYTLTVGP